MPGGMGDGMGGGQPMNPYGSHGCIEYGTESTVPNAPPADDDLKPIHLMSSFEIRNEKIDYIYKFKKLGEDRY